VTANLIKKQQTSMCNMLQTEAHQQVQQIGMQQGCCVEAPPLAVHHPASVLRCAAGHWCTVDYDYKSRFVYISERHWNHTGLYIPDLKERHMANEQMNERMGWGARVLCAQWHSSTKCTGAATAKDVGQLLT
jgi:hypothetical protein